MPRARKQCGHAHCTEKVPGGVTYCDSHKREKQWAGSTRNDEINQYEWQRVRAFVILRDGGRCYVCGVDGCNIVDHIKPVVLGGPLYDPANCACICKKHHDEKTARDGRMPKGR